MIDGYLERIYQACHVDFYLSANEGARVHWRWRMQPPSEATERYAEACDVYAVDSEPQDPTVENEEVLDTAYELNADFCLLVDYFPMREYERRLDNASQKPDWAEKFHSLKDEYDDGTPYPFSEASLDNVVEGLEIAEKHPYEGELMVPLQPPHTDFFQRVCDRWGNEPEYVAIGGLKDARPHRKVEAVENLRDYVGEGVHIHGLGWGASRGLVHTVRRNPDLLDSLDASTPVNKSMSHDTWKGSEKTTPTACFTLAYLTEACRRMSELTVEPDTVENKQKLLNSDYNG